MPVHAYDSKHFTGDSLKIERQNGFVVEGQDIGIRTKRRVCADLRDLLATVLTTFRRRGGESHRIAIVSEDDAAGPSAVLREMLARVEAERDALRAEVERLSAPVVVKARDISPEQVSALRAAQVRTPILLKPELPPPTREYYLVRQRTRRLYWWGAGWAPRGDAMKYTRDEAREIVAEQGGVVVHVQERDHAQPAHDPGEGPRPPLDGVETDRERIEVKVDSVLAGPDEPFGSVVGKRATLNTRTGEMVVEPDARYVLTYGVEDEIEGRFTSIAEAQSWADVGYDGFASIYAVDDYDRGVRRPVAWRSMEGVWHPADVGSR